MFGDVESAERRACSSLLQARENRTALLSVMGDRESERKKERKKERERKKESGLLKSL